MNKISPCQILDPIETAQSRNRAAMELLQQHQIPPSPVCYAVAYEYVAQRTPTLNQALDQHLEKHGSLNPHLLREFFETHFEAGTELQLDDHIASLHDTLYKVLEGVSSACHGISDFGRLLEGQMESLQGQTDLGSVRRIADTLLQATNQAISNNQKIQDNLASAERNTTELRNQVEQLREEAHRDSLTGLYNKKVLNQRLSQCIENSIESQTTLSVLMLDIDHFKHFNDSFGHLIGDEVIRRVAQTLQQRARKNDIAARYGGEEFTLVLPNTSLEDAIKVAEMIRSTVGKLVLVRKSTKEKLPGITISVGVASLHPDDSIETLLERADQALYYAKNHGRNCTIAESLLITEADSNNQKIAH
ncbi:GGDEF domain-containing protein [endosymbiont of Ridgeia piscesae]|jgi:diguanylate cyclase|uniref:diguanylate cyclase n=1 Tax=endosymbiont of Ridgeia piscesae TaxID=54398 RepID=A0A0T5YV03_9GAMM|nr:GGDEF domain-containing protein [endosymbiont of Ridgeia piscesae]KRT53941.1 diguanylate cyclase (GGDEF) domain [endosymbiont of Ridgeia piscesae]KRT57306.1 diguanylate cyclase [endosymbiont of Ridgeia piscesae]